LRLSERRATNIGLLYPKVRNNIGGDIPVDVPPQPKYWGGCVPGGVDASAPLPFYPLSSPFLPLEVGPLNTAKGSGERCKLAQWGRGKAAADKRFGA